MTNIGRRCFVTGGAGFIGSNLVDRLLARGDSVVVYDNFSTGVRRFLESAQQNAAFKLVEGDLLDLPALSAAMAGCDCVFHFSANADVRFGLEHRGKDLQQNTIATYNVLEAMQANSVRQIAFTSTGSIYGDSSEFPTPEDARLPHQTSLYGASKLAGESLIQAYCEGFPEMRGFIFRFVSVLGERYTHGHIFDFCKQLLADPTHLHILGDGSQRKSYIYVQDCLDGILKAIDTAEGNVNVLNVGSDGVISVLESVGVITRELGVQPELTFSGGSKGWVGDNPYIHLKTDRLQSLGWQPAVTMQEGVARTVRWLLANRWVFEGHS